MEYSGNGSSDVDSWKEVILVYSSALKEIETRIEILNDEFQHVHQYNPIEHIKSRIKTSESIVKKLRKHNYDATIDNMIQYVNDIAGIRIICSFTTDIYRIAQMLERQSDIRILSVKDYIKKPKASGYKSYHMIIAIPIYLSEKKVDAKVEIQIRTVAMDFWASLEHKINYKFDVNIPEHIKAELNTCAKMVSELDAKMLSLNEEVKKLSLD
ncbi:MAG: GTP pyrophosphokinase family protein [Lachnospiraceae bacterium]|nr:GTP pyrophosphokinase family protein [Lachnospiraceae bacterium]